MPSLWKSSGCLIGSSIISLTRWSSSFKPPMSSYDILFAPSTPGAGFSENSTWVFFVMMTASSGSISTTLNGMNCVWRKGSPLERGTISFFTTGKSMSELRTWGVILIETFRGRSSGGASTTRFASTSSCIRDILTVSPMLTPAFIRVKLSIRTLFWFQSSTRDLHTLATVLLLPSTATISPGDIFKKSMVSGSSRAFPPP
ncbi:MAG: hypothetical protein A4E39_01130 [Methanoregulaceae archaeon PtaB.Bin152]|nr:MAG: hypothetical protein A4E39_01130 [Methanoregulaceae archaeon PtaB.Bin152]